MGELKARSVVQILGLVVLPSVVFLAGAQWVVLNSVASAYEDATKSQFEAARVERSSHHSSVGERIDACNNRLEGVVDRVEQLAESIRRELRQHEDKTESRQKELADEIRRLKEQVDSVSGSVTEISDRTFEVANNLAVAVVDSMEKTIKDDPAAENSLRNILLAVRKNSKEEVVVLYRGVQIELTSYIHSVMGRMLATATDPDWRPGTEQLFFCSKGDDAGEDAVRNIFVFDFATNRLFQVTNNNRDERSPKVSPDGRQLAFSRERDRRSGAMDIYIARLNNLFKAGGTSIKIRRVTSDLNQGFTNLYSTWSPDGGKWLLFAQFLDPDLEVYDLVICDSETCGDWQTIGQAAQGRCQPFWCKNWDVLYSYQFPETKNHGIFRLEFEEFVDGKPRYSEPIPLLVPEEGSDEQFFCPTQVGNRVFFGYKKNRDSKAETHWLNTETEEQGVIFSSPAHSFVFPAAQFAPSR